MADPTTKQRIADALRRSFFRTSDECVNVSDGCNGNVHVQVVSHAFDGKGYREKRDLIWSTLVSSLSPAEWGKVTLSVGKSPAEAESA